MVRCPSPSPGGCPHHSVQPVRVIRLERADNEELIYYCPSCDPCPVCHSDSKSDGPPPYPADPGVLPIFPAVSCFESSAERWCRVPITIPIMMFLTEAVFCGGWRRLIIPHFLAIIFCCL